MKTIEVDAKGMHRNVRKKFIGCRFDSNLNPLKIKSATFGEIQFADSDVWIEDDLKYKLISTIDSLFISFQLSGTLFGNCTGEYPKQKFPTGFASCWYTPSKTGDIFIPGGQKIRRITLALNKKFISDRLGLSDTCLPKDFRLALEKDEHGYWHKHFRITPWIKSIIGQLDNNPYRGKLGRLFIESRCLELIMNSFEALEESSSRSGIIRLNSNDVEKIHCARDILLKNMNNPPTITSLAKQVCLSETKLKSGFRHLFNSTIFAYLRRHRMHQARNLLSKGDMNVSEVAYTVGYTNVSNFAKAFRQEHGILPKFILKKTKDKITNSVSISD